MFCKLWGFFSLQNSVCFHLSVATLLISTNFMFFDFDWYEAHQEVSSKLVRLVHGIHLVAKE